MINGQQGLVRDEDQDVIHREITAGDLKSIVFFMEKSKMRNSGKLSFGKRHSWRKEREENILKHEEETGKKGARDPDSIPQA